MKFLIVKVFSRAGAMKLMQNASLAPGIISGTLFSSIAGMAYLLLLHEPGPVFYPFAALVFSEARSSPERQELPGPANIHTGHFLSRVAPFLPQRLYCFL
jgi:hypothetical protein